MSKPTLAGAAALLAAPVTVGVGVAVLPTLSDDGATQVAALGNHRHAMIAGLTLQTLALALLIGGAIWLAHTVAPRAPRLALAGGILTTLGALFPLLDDGVSAATPALVTTLDPTQAAAAIDAIHSSAAVTLIGPLSLLQDLGLALLGVAASRAGTPRWTAVAIAIGAVGEGAGFGSDNRPLVLAGFAILLVGLLSVVRALLARPAERTSQATVPA